MAGAVPVSLFRFAEGRIRRSRKTQRAAKGDAARSDDRCSTLRGLLQRTALWRKMCKGHTSLPVMATGAPPLVLSQQVFAWSGLQSHLGSCLELHHLLLGDGDGSASGGVDALMSGTCGH